VLKHLPNIISVIRFLLAFVFLWLFIEGEGYYTEALVVFVIGAVSDWADGFIARKYNIVSQFGEHFDPLADKVLTLSAFFAFAISGIINIWLVVVVAFRDVVTTAMRYMLFAKRHIPTSKSAKFKTILQLVFIILILLLRSLSDNTKHPIVADILHSSAIDWGMLVITVLTVWTMVEYIWQVAKTNKR
jgi:CDP-diacylglycerol--glycerol-3-phosphate 3-phosphatidyltransferase